MVRKICTSVLCSLIFLLTQSHTYSIHNTHTTHINNIKLRFLPVKNREFLGGIGYYLDGPYIYIIYILVRYVLCYDDYCLVEGGSWHMTLSSCYSSIIHKNQELWLLLLLSSSYYLNTFHMTLWLCLYISKIPSESKVTSLFEFDLCRKYMNCTLYVQCKV